MKKLPLAILICSILITVGILVFRPEKDATEEIEIQTNEQLYILGKEYIGSEYTVLKMDFESGELLEVLVLPKEGYWRFIDGATHDCLYIANQKEALNHSVEIYSWTGEELSRLLEVNIPHDALVIGYVQGKVYCRDGYYDLETEEYHENEDDYYYLSVKPNGDLLTYQEPWIGIEKADGTTQRCIQGTKHSVWGAKGSGFIYLDPEEIPHYHIYSYEIGTEQSMEHPELKEEYTNVASYCHDVALSSDGKYFAYYSYNPGKAYIKKDTMDTNLIITDLSTGESLIFDDNAYEYIFEYALRWVSTNE